MGAFVPIRQYLGDNRWFSPADLDAMGKAFTTALGKLGLNDRSEFVSPAMPSGAASFAFAPAASSICAISTFPC